jgi:hypothetical protein
MNTADEDLDEIINSFPENNSHYIRESHNINIIEFSRPSYCIKCKIMTGHNTPPRLVVIKNGRPAMSSFCWRCRSRKIRLVSYRLYQENTGRKLCIIVYVYL